MTAIEKLLRQGMSSEEVVKQLNEAEKKIKAEEEEKKQKIAAEKIRTANIKMEENALIEAYKHYYITIKDSEPSEEQLDYFLSMAKYITSHTVNYRSNAVKEVSRWNEILDWLYS